MYILADQSAALAEFNQMILGALRSLACPGGQQRGASVDHSRFRSVAGFERVKWKSRHVDLLTLRYLDIWIRVLRQIQQKLAK